MKFLSPILLIYLRWAARIQVRKFHSQTIIGITGSAGKSSTREAVNAVVSPEFATLHCAHGNSETGVPLDLLGITIGDYSLLDWLRIAFLVPVRLMFSWKHYQLIILEMGVDSPKSPRNMSYLLSIVQPNLAVFTNVSGVHGENFDYLVDQSITGDQRIELIKDQIAKEKGKLIESLPGNGIAILNSQDHRVGQFHNSQTQIITVGTDHKNQIQFSRHIVSPAQGTQFDFLISNEKYSVKFPKHLLSYQYGYTFGFAIATGIALKLPPAKIIANLESNFKLPASRMSLFPGIHQSLIIDSSYNASENSMIDAIELLSTIKHSGPKIAILGDLRELGQTAYDVHLRIWKAANQVADQVYTVGPNFQKINPKGWLKANEAWDSIQELIPTNSLVLIKGSQNTIFLETIVQRLLKNPSDQSQLCRQNSFWQKTKIKFFSN